MKKCLVLLLAGAALGAVSASADTIKKPKFLFLDLVDAASCLDEVVKKDVDVGRWTAIITMAKETPVPGCASCYSFIDGVNVIGVLPIVKDTLREPFLVHSPKKSDGNYYYKNHANSWFWTPSKSVEYTNPVEIGDTATIAAATVIAATSNSGNLRYSVTKEDLFNLATVKGSGDPNSFKLSAYATATSSNGPSAGPSSLEPSALKTSTSAFMQNLASDTMLLPGSKEGASMLVVPDSLAPLPPNTGLPQTKDAFRTAYALPYPKPALVRTTTELAEMDDRSRDKPLIDVTGNPIAGTIQLRADPVLRADQKSPDATHLNQAPVFWPAKEYYANATLTPIGEDLKLCGVNYEVREYGSAYQGFLERLAVAMTNKAATIAPGGSDYWVDKSGLSVPRDVADFNGVTGFWTGRWLE